jgi:hypothetical protein
MFLLIRVLFNSAILEILLNTESKYLVNLILNRVKIKNKKFQQYK